MSWRIAAAALLIGLAIGAAVNGWRLGEQMERERKEQKQALIETQDKLVRQGIEHRKALEQLDVRYTQELNHAKANSDRLRADIAAGRTRLSVAVAKAGRCHGVPAATGAAGVDDGAARVELDRTTAERIVSTATDGDQAIRQLTALQAYVRQVCLKE